MKEKELEKIFKALANKRRILILKFLKVKTKESVGNIAEKIKLSFKATSKHLIILSNADILDKEQVSLTVLYSLSKTNSKIIKNILDFL